MPIENRHRLPLECHRGFATTAFTACVARNDRPFCESVIVDEAVKALETSAAKYACKLLIWCFMPDHMHSIVQGESERADTWKAMVGFKQSTGYWFAKNRPEFGWQKDFYDHIVRSDENLDTQVQYIADNPVRAGLVTRWEDYPFTGGSLMLCEDSTRRSLKPAATIVTR